MLTSAALRLCALLLAPALLPGVSRADEQKMRPVDIFDMMSKAERTLSDAIVTKDREAMGTAFGQMTVAKIKARTGEVPEPCASAARALSALVAAAKDYVWPISGYSDTPAVVRRKWLDAFPGYNDAASACARAVQRPVARYLPRDLFAARANEMLCDQDIDHLNPDCPR